MDTKHGLDGVVGAVEPPRGVGRRMGDVCKRDGRRGKIGGGRVREACGSDVELEGCRDGRGPLEEAAPAWRTIRVQAAVKYLRVLIGPGAAASEWDEALAKFRACAERLAGLAWGHALGLSALGGLHPWAPPRPSATIGHRFRRSASCFWLLVEGWSRPLGPVPLPSLAVDLALLHSATLVRIAICTAPGCLKPFRHVCGLRRSCATRRRRP